ncbi:hypothetical protein D3Y57_17390 [Sphingomonas paeninsulae]|jgi:hypothetical protein|uniref:Uncharacterized protein n=1 Tax=Sphingomonas paeninsulae TaxID=2319844 RepID=A0A494TD08_SPHPE|nr:hypothetical protein [Sphingomonas paeninsulae]AYJ87379.1 hypothetical protein D3Y57_17390 [Sphingomonas paeninsulae]
MKKFLIALALTGVAIGDVAVAYAAITPVNVRQVNQERRIDAGKRSGKLSRAERDRLTAQQHRIAREESRSRARHGGRLTKSEKARIHRMQANANRNINHDKRNNVRGRNGIHL